MTKLLARIAVRRPRTVIAGWLLTAVCGLVVTGPVGSPADPGFAVRGSDSARAATLLAEHIPGHRGIELLVAVTLPAPSAAEGDWIANATRLVRGALAPPD